MENENQLDYGSNEIKELLLYTINDILVISKEIEWSLVLDNNSNPKMSVKITVNGRPYIFSELSNYFYERDFLNVPINHLNNLYKLLLELRVIGKKIEQLSEVDKISVFDFVDEMIKLRYKQSSGEFFYDERYKDMIMIELGLDVVDKLGNAKNETLALLEVIMLKR